MAGRVFYGWWVVLCSVATLVGTLPGQTVVVSVFNPRIQADLQVNAGQISLAYMVATLSASLPMSYFGRLSDRHGPRRVTLAVALAMVGTCVFMGRAGSWWALVLGFFGLRMFGQGAMGMLSGHAVALWFEGGLRRVEALRGGAMSLASAAVPPLAFVLIESVGWRWAYPLLGFAVFILVVPLVVFVQKDRPESMGLRLDGKPSSEPTEAPLNGMTLREAMHTSTYWVLLFLGVLHASFGTALLFHNQALAKTSGISSSAAAWSLSAFGLSSLVGTLLLFVLGTRLPERLALTIIPVTLSSACLGVAYAQDTALFAVSMVLLGAGMALMQATWTPAIALAFGRRHHGIIRGSYMTSMVAGTALGPVILGYSLEWTGSFRPGLFLVPVLGALLLFAIQQIPLSFAGPKA